MKKIISLIIFAVLALALSVTAFAADIIASGYCGGEGDGKNLEWKLDSDGVLTISGEGKMANYDIEWLQIGEFATTAPWGELMYEIFEIIIENGVSNIGEYAFAGFVTFNEIIIPKSIEIIEFGAFAYNYNKSYIIEGNPEFYYNSFSGSNLKFLFMDGAPRKIHSWLNLSDEDLYYLAGTEEKWTFDENGLWNGYEVKPYVPSEGIKIDASAYVASGYCGTDFLGGKNMAWGLDSEGTLTIFGSGEMADYAMMGNKGTSARWGRYRYSVKKIIIEDGVTNIGKSAFYGMYYLEKAPNIASSVKVIESYAFYNCNFADELVFPEGVEFIEFYSFAGNEFTLIKIPSTLKEIEWDSFMYCSNIQNIEVSENNNAFCDIEGVVYSKDKNTIIFYPTGRKDEYIVCEETKEIGNGSFFNCSGNIILKENIKTIGNAAFAEFDGSIIIKGQLDSIEERAFCAWFEDTISVCFMNGEPKAVSDRFIDNNGGAVNLYYLSGTEDLWNFDENGLWNGYEVKPFVMGEEVEFDSGLYVASGYCGADPFGGKNLAWGLDSEGTLTIFGSGKMADFEKGWNNDRSEYIITTPWHEYKDSIKTLVIENGVTSVGKNAFYEFENFEGTLVIPETVSEIGDFAFYGCGFDTNLTIPGNVKIIGESAFSDWRITYTYGKLTVCEGVEVIKSGAFSFSDFDSAEIPSTVHTIGTGIFQFDMVLENLVISEENDHYAAEDKIIYTKDKTKLLECLMTKTGEYTVPETVTEICDEAFWNTGLASVTVPENVKTIGEGAFERCYYDVYIMGQLESIGAHAFNIYSGSSDVYFFGAAPKKVESGNSNSYWNSFSDEYVNIYYIEGKEGWDLDENGLWNGFKVHPYVPGEEVELDPSLYIASGYCGANRFIGGKNIAWGLDSEGTLTIFGKGEMADYDSFDKYGKEEVISSVSMFSVNRKTEAMPFGGGEITNPSSNPAPWHIYEGKIKKLVLEEGITKIGVYAFWGMGIPGELSIPESVKVIDDWSFCANKFKGENLVIPEGVERIGVAAFQGAGFFKNAYIPASVTDMHKPPFRYCETENIFVDEDNEYYKSVDGILFSKDGKEIIQFPDGRTGSYILPETVTVISTSAFEDSALSEITVKGNIEYIENAAFQVYNGAIIFEGKVGEVYNAAFRPHDWAGEKQEIIFMAGPPETIQISVNWSSFNEGCVIYYLSGTENLWNFDENGLWNGYEVKPFSFHACGDVDGNGKVNVLDANIIRRASARLLELDYAQELAADVDGNGKINVLDANLIRRYSAKLIDKFPAEG